MQAKDDTHEGCRQQQQQLIQTLRRLDSVSMHNLHDKMSFVVDNNIVKKHAKSGGSDNDST